MASPSSPTASWLAAPGAERPCTVIGEVAQAHDGSLGQAHAFIDAIADAGADAVKFQTHIASAESTPAEPWRKKFSLQDETRYDYWRRMEFTEPQWHGLKAHAAERGLMFLSSPFSPEAVELLKLSGGELKTAIVVQRLGLSPEHARARLQSARGHLREALESLPQTNGQA